MSASTSRSSAGQYTGAPVCARERRDRADVVEVGVREQDRRRSSRRARLTASISRSGSSPGSISSAADDTALADDIGVLLERPDGERANVERSITAPTVAPACARRYM